MAVPVRILPANLTHLPQGGAPVVAIFGGAQGGVIQNPATAEDQNIPVVEILFININGDAGLLEDANTFALQPGQRYVVPPGLTTNVSVNAETAGHRFSAFVIQPAAPAPTPIPSDFPPAGPTSLQNVIPSYLYDQYKDDDDLQAFVASYNQLAQEYVTLFNQLQLGVYTSPLIAGDLLDWIALGIYGVRRPALASLITNDIGPYNTGMFNEVGYNLNQRRGSGVVSVTTDDAFKRILTWRLYRGDGKTFNLYWLKRRLVRFIHGQNGTSPVITNTHEVSAKYSDPSTIDIVLPADPNSTILKQAIDAGVCELPFQLKFNVAIAS